ncbi:MAG: outer membrane beta-barrel family protein [Paenibacillus sp.]|nr:outer membrane beta-barrel family protein [Paenibacillus sp.]
MTGSAYPGLEVPDTLGRVESLGEVVVKSDNIIVTPDKMIVSVDKQVKRHAYDGYSALSLMSIPGLNVSVFDHTVSAFGKDVQLLINGLEATTDEIKTLNPKDIKRIDYYTNFDLRYPTKEYVLDFIMVVRERGGAVMLQAGKSLNQDDADGLADWRMFRNKTEFGVRVNGGLIRHNERYGGVGKITMQFPDGELVENHRLLFRHDRSNDGSVKFTLLHRYTNGVMKSAVGLGSRHSTDNSSADESYSGLRDMYLLRSDANHTDKLYPSFSISYDHKYPSKVLLSYSLKGSYTHTDKEGALFQENSWLSYTHENFIDLNPRVKLTVPIVKKVSSYASVNYFYSNSRQHYVENDRRQDTRLINGQAIIEAGANYNVHRNTSLTLRLQERVVTTDAGYGSGTQSYFTPAVYMSYRFLRNNNIKFGVFSGVYDPVLSYYTAEEKRVDDYVVRVGNPDLKLMKPLGVNLMWASAHNWGNVFMNTGYENTAHAIITDFTLDIDRNVYVQSYYNGGHYENLRWQLGADWNVLPNRLKISGCVNYEYNRLPGREIWSKGGFYGQGSVTFMQGGFSGKVDVTTQRSLLTRFGSFQRVPFRMDIALGYAVDGWSFNLMARNPFIKVHNVSWSRYGGWTEWNESYSPKEDYNKFEVKVSYRLNYGKKHKFEDVKLDTAPKSAIL